MPHVGELILLAAPSCCGKSYFLEQLYEGRLQHLVQRMALDEPIHSYVSVIPKELQDYRGSYVPRMILHFAIPTIALVDGSLTSLEDEPRLDVVKSAERVTVITLLASADVLASRLRSRQRSNRRMIFRNIAKYRSERRKIGADLRRSRGRGRCLRGLVPIRRLSCQREDVVDRDGPA